MVVMVVTKKLNLTAEERKLRQRAQKRASDRKRRAEWTPEEREYQRQRHLKKDRAYKARKRAADPTWGRKYATNEESLAARVRASVLANQRWRQKEKDRLQREWREYQERKLKEDDRRGGSSGGGGSSP